MTGFIAKKQNATKKLPSSQTLINLTLYLMKRSTSLEKATPYPENISDPQYRRGTKRQPRSMPNWPDRKCKSSS